jgi:sirohydrochlorin ferrochelatase
MNVVLVAHGTRSDEGTRVSERLADALRRRLPQHSVELAFADVRGPTIAQVLDGLAGDTVLLPAFLARGYHVRADIPAQVAERRGVIIADALGPAPELVTAVAQRVRQASPRRDLPVVLAAAGSTDSAALADIQLAARRLQDHLDRHVSIGYVTGDGPSVDEMVARGPCVVASWLLAPGLFHRWITASGAVAVADPIGAHPLLVDLLVRRVHAAREAPLPRQFS